MQLPFKRFVKQVSNGGSFSRYGFIEMMQRNAKALEAAAWREARCAADAVSLTVGQIVRTDGTVDEETGAWTSPPTYTAWIDDRYDVFAQAGDGVQKMASMCGYAGCVAYRFTLPTANQSALDALSLRIQRDRYLRAGVRIAAYLSNAETPSDDWSLIRGEAAGGHCTESTTPETPVLGAASWGFLGQPDVPYLLAGRAMEGTWSVGSSTDSAFPTAAAYKYLYVYITLEDPAGYWEWYSAKDARYYYIEGSAMLVPSLCDFTFASADTSAPSETWHEAWGLTPIRDTIVEAWHGTPELVGAGGIASLGVMSGMAVCHGNILEIAAAVRGAMLNGATAELMLPDTIVDPACRLAAGDLNKFGGIPYITQPGSSLFMILRNTVRSAPIPGSEGEYGPDIQYDADAAQFTTNATGQAFFGYMQHVVPAGKAAYSKLKIRSLAHDLVCSHCRVSLNVWRSRSVDCFGPFANVAIAALAKDPAFFTGKKSSISANATIEYSMNEGQTASVDVSAKAELIANADVSEFALAANAPAQDDGAELTLDNLNLLPGDVLILAPCLDSVDASTDQQSVKVIGWHGPTMSDLETASIIPNVGLQPLLYVI